MLAMRKSTRFRRFLVAALSVSAAVLLGTVSLPHRHDDSAVSHPAQSCNFCRVQSTFSATTPTSSIALHKLPLVAREVIHFFLLPRTTAALRVSSPRAPPVFS